jgi:hypothetical protein
MADLQRISTNVPPTKAMMTSYETLTWVAFRRAMPPEQFRTILRATFDRWLISRPDNLLTALEARAGISGNGPFYAWRPGPGLFSEAGPIMLRCIRRKRRQETQQLVTFGDLVQMLRADLAADAVLHNQILNAEEQVRNSAAGGLLVGYGIPCEPCEGWSAGIVQPLPATLFMHPTVELSLTGTLIANIARPPFEGLGHEQLRFDSVQFRTADVLRLWPAQTDTTFPGAGSDRADEEAAFALSQSSLCKRLPAKLRREPRACAAFRKMHRYAQEYKQSNDTPVKRDDAARVAGSTSKYPVRRARELYQYLPAALRNPPRIA